MASMVNELRHLAARVGTGDATAAAELRRELEPDMLRVVRRALRATAGPSALTRQVRLAADRLARQGEVGPAAGAEHMAGRVARDLCDSLVGRLQAGRREGHCPRETVRNY